MRPIIFSRPDRFGRRSHSREPRRYLCVICDESLHAVQTRDNIDAMFAFHHHLNALSRWMALPPAAGL